jgi:mRNA interferase MazF
MRSLKVKLNRGNIVLCKVPMPTTELKEFKLRPGLIVSKDFNNKRLDDLIIVICTFNISRSHEPTQYLIEGDEIIQAGIKVSSVVKCESLLTINVIVHPHPNPPPSRGRELIRLLDMLINIPPPLVGGG